LVVADLTERDAIATVKRFEGMTTYVTAEEKTFQLQGGITNSDWVEFGAGTDEKVKYDAGDPTAGYVADKIIAGTGISVAEGTGANENKLVITNSAPAVAETDPLSLHLDQTTPQTLTNQPIVTVADTDYVLINDTSDGGKLKKVLKTDFEGGGGGGEDSHGITIDGGSTDILSGVKGYFTVPYNCTITGWSITSQQTGSVVFDIWKASGTIPTVADSITASAKPTLLSAQLASSSSLTGWTTSLVAGDVLVYNIDSISFIKKVTLLIKITK
jgi:hypothetical protein